jgi:PPOX class probable F420-dependent enzyme
MDAAADLDRHRYLSLATFRANGTPVATPMWFIALDGRLYIGTLAESGKVKRLRRSPRARIALCDRRGRLRGEWRDVTARLVDDAALAARAEAALRRKYGWQKALLNLLARLRGRRHRRAHIEIEL